MERSPQLPSRGPCANRPLTCWLLLLWFGSLRGPRALSDGTQREDVGARRNLPDFMVLSPTSTSGEAETQRQAGSCEWQSWAPPQASWPPGGILSPTSPPAAPRLPCLSRGPGGGVCRAQLPHSGVGGPGFRLPTDRPEDPQLYLMCISHVGCYGSGGDFKDTT